MNIRVGFGFDVHSLEEGIPFYLGGVLIQHTKGAKGHSDADVVLHAVCDALLGAAALGDIGKHFPDTSSEFKGIDSKILLKRVVELLSSKGYKTGNVDVSLVLEKPKIAPYISQMQQAIAEVMNMDTGCISVKATTNERMGYVGREEGVAAYAVVLIEKI
ncbi:MAG: 2-C-methyl-D-erythritol 2,4-cyclodiphosphate synthase [Bacteroidetes bacterium ADurb.Bin141]|nr:MAG: 2-C-methyl-D-erythritol 2,4-cyclodiphosphate synthase [Bacteroidetes bacterium ADurb.Bin141]